MRIISFLSSYACSYDRKRVNKFLRSTKYSRFTYFKNRITKTANQYQCHHKRKLYPENYFGISVLAEYMEQKIKINVYLVHGWANHKFLFPAVKSNIPCVTYLANYTRKTMHLINIPAHARLDICNAAKRTRIIILQLLLLWTIERKQKRITNYIFQLLSDFFKQLLCLG